MGQRGANGGQKDAGVGLKKGMEPRFCSVPFPFGSQAAKKGTGIAIHLSALWVETGIFYVWVSPTETKVANHNADPATAESSRTPFGEPRTSAETWGHQAPGRGVNLSWLSFVLAEEEKKRLDCPTILSRDPSRKVKRMGGSNNLQNNAAGTTPEPLVSPLCGQGRQTRI